VVSLSVVGLYVIPLLRALSTQNTAELIPFAGMLTTVGINEAIKYYIIGTTSPRPKEARDCNLWVNNGPQGGRPGAPSGHSAHVSFFVGYYLQTLSNTAPWLSLILIGYGLLVMLSRYTKSCHTLPQILSGSALGLFLSVLFYRYAVRL
jgi:membrane-associated phospholipid phosphatase